MVLRAGAIDVGLDADDMLSAIQRPEIKEALRAATDEAWRLGVSGAPCTRVRGVIFYGDDRLDEAAARLASPR